MPRKPNEQTVTLLCTAARYYLANQPGVTQRQVAAQFGVAQGSLSDVLSAVKHVPDFIDRVETGRASVYSARKVMHDVTWEPEEHKRIKRLQKVREMAAAGHHTDAIADAIGLSVARLRELMADNKIKSAGVRNAPHVDARRVLDETVHGLAGYVIGLQFIDVRKVTREQAAELTDSLGESLRALKRLHKQLQEIERGPHDQA